MMHGCVDAQGVRAHQIAYYLHVRLDETASKCALWGPPERLLAGWRGPGASRQVPALACRLRTARRRCQCAGMGYMAQACGRAAWDLTRSLLRERVMSAVGMPSVALICCLRSPTVALSSTCILSRPSLSGVMH